MTTTCNQKPTGFTSETLALRDFLACEAVAVHRIERAAFSLEARWSKDGVWFLLNRRGRGALALRGAPGHGPFEVELKQRHEDGFALIVTNAEGRYESACQLIDENTLRLTISLTPASDLLIPFWPRDLYPLGDEFDPTRAEGWVEAAQRGLNTGLCFFGLKKPKFGAGLYLQDLTSLNGYFEESHSKPDGAVGGRWPELGYQPPSAPTGNSPPEHALKKGQTIVVSDAYLTWDAQGPDTEEESAEIFLKLFARLYQHIQKPARDEHDWRARAKKTLQSLYDPAARMHYEGAAFLHPYVDAEYPDCMVQATVAAALAEYEAQFGADQRHAGALVAGLDKFFDPSLKTLRRYLPNVGDDKNRTEVDSWYLYHPLMNLARLAGHGHEKARELFLASIDYAIKAAHHFQYRWPITFDVVDFHVLKQSRDDQGHGQTDVAGMYAFVMLLAEEMTGEAHYLDEARAAIRAASNLRFELAYQTNLTAWGALACAKLAQRDDDAFFRKQTLVYLASFLHNCEAWKSNIERAKHYSNFLSATCLHDGPYMAAFECFDSFAAFEELLRTARDQIPDHVAEILRDYCLYALDRAWFYYPDVMPEGMLSDKIRNGRIDAALSFPVEDLYADGQPAGQVGQEIYGCGGAFTFAVRGERFTGEH